MGRPKWHRLALTISRIAARARSDHIVGHEFETPALDGLTLDFILATITLVATPHWLIQHNIQYTLSFEDIMKYAEFSQTAALTIQTRFCKIPLLNWKISKYFWKNKNEMSCYIISWKGKTSVLDNTFIYQWLVTHIFHSKQNFHAFLHHQDGYILTNQGISLYTYLTFNWLTIRLPPFYIRRRNTRRTIELFLLLHNNVPHWHEFLITCHCILFRQFAKFGFCSKEWKSKVVHENDPFLVTLKCSLQL